MSEHSEQVALFEWAAWQVNLGVEPLRWMFAIPNGELRKPSVAGRLKAEGVKAGVSDIYLPYPAQGYHGLFVEMKVKPNKPTPAQCQWLDWFNSQGYLAKVAYGFDEAKEILCEYLGINDDR